MPSPVAALKAVLTEKTFFAESKLSPDLVERLRDLAPAEEQQVVAMFIAAAKRYDDGHRPQDGTTIDVMLNDVFPAFGSSALLALFDHFRKLAYLTTDERIARRGKLHRHGALDTLEDLIRWSKERSHAVTDLAKAAERPNVVRAMKATFTALKRLVAKLDAEDAATLPARLDAIGATELAADIATLGLAYGYDDPATAAFHRAVLRHLDALSFDALLGYARVCIAAHAYPALEPALVYLFLKDAKQAHAFILSREGIRGRGATNTAMIALTAEQMKDATRWPRDPWRKVLKESPATLKLLAAAKAALQPCFADPLERVELR